MRKGWTYKNHHKPMRRDENGHGGGGGGTTPAGGGDNQQGNQQQNPGNTGGSADNTGQQFDATSFWADPQSSGDSNNQNQQGQGGGNDDSSGNLGTTLVERLQATQFGALFDDAISQEIADGKLDGINNRFNDMGRQMIRQSLMLNAEILRAYAPTIMSQVEQLLDSRLGSRDDQETLVKEFPAASDPKVAPVIRQVFDQSMKHAKGDRKAAVQMTKEMLKIMGQTASADFGFESPPNSRGDSNSDATASLLRDLLER